MRLLMQVMHMVLGLRIQGSEKTERDKEREQTLGEWKRMQSVGEVWLRHNFQGLGLHDRFTTADPCNQIVEQTALGETSAAQSRP